MDAIVKFFTETIPNFAQTNWLAIEIVLAAIAVVLFVVLCIVAGLKRKQKKESTAQIMEWVSKNTERVKLIEKHEKDYKELNELYIQSVSDCKKLEEVSAERIEAVKKELSEKTESLEKELTVCKETLVEREISLATSIKECQEKDTKIANMTLEKDSMVEKLETAHSDFNCVVAANDELNAEVKRLETELNLEREGHEKVELEYNELAAKHLAAEKALVETSDKLADLEVKYSDALKEIDYLKNYELENEVLLKTLRKFKKDDEVATADTKDAIFDLEKRLNARIETIFESMSAKIISANAKNYKLDATELEGLKRSELSKIAKEIGLTNYATWTNEKLRTEIAKYKK